VTRLENEKEQARQDVKPSPVKRTRAVKKWLKKKAKHWNLCENKLEYKSGNP
jgi:hypothetical protein